MHPHTSPDDPYIQTLKRVGARLPGSCGPRCP